MTNIEIELDHVGMGTIKIDGHNISNVTYKTTVYTEAGQSNRVVLELWGHNIKVIAPAEIIAGLRDPVIESLRKNLSDEDIERIANLVADILSKKALIQR